MKLEYVVSGTSYMRINNPGVTKNPDCVKIVNDIFDKQFANAPGHTFSMLYNAFTEKSFGERFQVFRSHVDKFHADSGGLQIITLGKTITPELKDEVYRNQAKWADVGMCFDEIPVEVKDGKSDRNDTTGRRFARELFEEKAKQTGENVKRQLEVYKQENSNCKPFVICQGNDVQTYMNWADIIMNTIEPEDHNRVGGIAMGAAALGTGPKEDIQRAFIPSQLDVRDENGDMHLHVLGVGSLRRLLPYIIFQQNGLYKNIKISYDSTTHSRGVETGLYYYQGKTMKFDRNLATMSSKDKNTPMYIKIYEDCELDIGLERFHKICNTPSIDWSTNHGTYNEWIQIRTTLVCKSIYNFMSHVNSVLTSKENLLHFAEDLGEYAPYKELYNIKDQKDFNEWYNDPHLGGSIASQAISDTWQDEETNTLEALWS